MLHVARCEDPGLVPDILHEKMYQHLLWSDNIFDFVHQSGYWQSKNAKKDKDKTAYTFHNGFLDLWRMPFGLKNAPRTFQQDMEVLLTRVEWQFALVYLDDIVIFRARQTNISFTIDKDLRSSTV